MGFLFFYLTRPAAADNNVIVYGADEAFRPYEWFSDDGKLEGFQIELMRAIAEKSGRRVNFVTGAWNSIRSDFIDGKVQVVSMFDQPVRHEYADFSKPHSVLASEIFIRRGSKPIVSLAELNGKEIIQQAGALSTEYLRTQAIRYTSIPVRDPFEAMRLLASGKHDCVITTQVGGRYALQKLGLTGIISTGQPILASNVAFAVRKGNAEILRWLNDGIDKVRADGTYEELYQKWFGEAQQLRKVELQKLQRIFFAALAVLVVIIAVGLLWVKMLRRAVAAKTYELQYLADHDSLTGVYNRHYITNAVSEAIHEFKHHGVKGSFGLLFIDLDRFKLVNDSLGHHVGDLVIKAVAFEILAAVDDRCLVARWGGDEFIVLVRSVPHGGTLERIAQRISEKLRSPYHFRDKDIYVGASIGAVMASLRYQRAEEMLRDADNAMYTAKADKRSSVRLFEPQMHEIAVRSMRLSSEFRKAVERGEIINYYQPIYTLKNAELSGFEALVRWQHPELGLLVPGSFMPILEKTDAMRLLGDCVLKGALAAAKSWISRGGKSFYISVNISDEQFAFGNLTETLRNAIAAEGIPPHFLRLEITETVLMADTVAGMSQLDELKRMGLRILIDDFGTGFSSLSHLASIPA
ncbi:MAG: transporter substrate-binding domain-containing protein, partial [Spirochaetes bacterium]|nr:transporter substrate-binding domain-containing protein [Spirochaetota bacterium]